MLNGRNANAFTSNYKTTTILEQPFIDHQTTAILTYKQTANAVDFLNAITCNLSKSGNGSKRGNLDLLYNFIPGI
uniref:Uncharacterized protein n=1 Tax=Romanomermis culicivorax TaxID=13658 RepID=A0A915K2Q7_ROMCU